MHFLEVVAVGRSLGSNRIVSNVSFTQLQLQNIAIAGETGSGKSTLLKMIAGLVQPGEGQLIFEGEQIEGPDEKLIPGHPGIAYLSQVFELPKFLRVEQVLRYASNIPDEEAQQLFRICRITHLLKRRTDELSGGEQQRTALARLLVMRPKLLLLDEPFSNLDLIHKGILKTLLQELQQQLKISIILTSHDPQDTLPWADTIGVMKEGEMQQWGTPEQVYRQPQNEYVAGLLGKYNILSGATCNLLLIEKFQPDSRIMVRPSAFDISASSAEHANARIVAIHFAGSFYELNVQIADQQLTLFSQSPDWNVNDPIRLLLHPNTVWQLKD